MIWEFNWCIQSCTRFLDRHITCRQTLMKLTDKRQMGKRFTSTSSTLDVYVCMVGSINDILGSFQQFFWWLSISHFRPKDELDDCSLLSPVPMEKWRISRPSKYGSYIYIYNHQKTAKKRWVPIVYTNTISHIFLLNVNICFCEKRVSLVTTFYLFRNRKPSQETLSDDALHGVWEELDHKNEGELVWWPSWGWKDGSVGVLKNFWRWNGWNIGMGGLEDNFPFLNGIFILEVWNIIFLF